MSLAGHGPKSGSRNICLIRANWTATSSAMQGWQKCQWCSSPPEGGLVEAGGVSASSLPLSVDRPEQMLDNPLKSLCAKPSKIQHCWDRPVYREEFWRPEETCYYETPVKNLSTDADVKKKNCKKWKTNTKMMMFRSLNSCLVSWDVMTSWC